MKWSFRREVNGRALAWLPPPRVVAPNGHPKRVRIAVVDLQGARP